MDVDVVVDVAVEPTAALKALGEAHRWRIVELLSREELCVCHLAEDLAIPQPLVSHHLKVLRDAGLIENEKYRQWTYYRLRPGALDDLVERLGAVTACCPARGERRRPCA